VADRITDFDGAGRILSAQMNAAVRAIDRPKAGVVGALDPGDTVEIKRKNRVQKTRLGDERFNDIKLRTLIVKAAHGLAASGAVFSGSSETDAVNGKLWTMAYGGRIQARKFLRGGLLGSPANALNDIFKNGNKYGFECATAMMVIFHKAILEMVGSKEFDEMFTEPNYLRFFRWDLKDDDYLALEKITKKAGTLVPGTHYYFRNPDASEENSAFRGENVIYLGKNEAGADLFYAHGIFGADQTYVVTRDEIMDTLRRLRKPGSRVEPHLLEFSYSLDANQLLERIKQD
jgi:protein-glutamine gamma-glutamyltransferase